jgi:hypothetical protein
MMALQQTASTLPIVFAQVSVPVTAGPVASLARPAGRQITEDALAADTT